MASVGKYDLVNLSFGTYAPDYPLLLWEAIVALQRGARLTDANGNAIQRQDDKAAVVVASAGNDATWLAPMPASLPGVVSVAALDEHECGPAWFSNYGPWVSACAPGTKIPADFWTWAGKRTWDGYARWSGTSFAAPYVVGALAKEMNQNGWTDARDAVTVLITDPTRPRLPWHGTIIKDR
jgi:subtilisin family serine protease